MNKEQAAKLWPLIKQFGEGKSVEFYCKINRLWMRLDNPSFDPEYEYRIKPEPTMRPWRPEEVPIGALIRGSFYCVRVIQGYGPCQESLGDYVLYLNSNCQLTGDSLKGCLENREYSTDNGKTWHPCGVME